MENVIQQQENPFERADAAHQKGVDAYIEWGQALAELSKSGFTQQELAGRYGCSQSQMQRAICVGSDSRITHNVGNLPKDTLTLWLLSTLDDAEFAELATPTVRRKDVEEFKRMKKERAKNQGDGWVKIAMEEYEGFVSIPWKGRSKLRDEVSAMVGFSLSDRLKTPEQSEAIRQAFRQINRDHHKKELPPEADLSLLNKKEKKEFDKAIERLQAEFEQKVWEEAEKRLSDAREVDLNRAKEQAADAKRFEGIWRSRLNDAKTFLHLFRDSWRTVSASVHPDRPDRTQEQLQNASAAMNKMKAAFDRIDLDKWGN